MQKNSVLEEKNFSVAILVGGLGTRLKPLWPNIPKSLAPIKNKPFLSYIFDYLISQNIREVNLLVGYKSNQIFNFYGDQYKNLSIFYFKEEYQLGTGGAVKNFALTNNSKRYSLIINGDTYFPFDLYKFLNTIPNNMDSIVCTKVSDSSRYGSLIISKKNLLKNFEEKSYKNQSYINAGIYYLDLKKIADFRMKKFSLELDYFEYNLKKGIKIYVHFDPAIFIDIGIPEDFKKAYKILNDL